jgi:hypothetical protein
MDEPIAGTAGQSGGVNIPAPSATSPSATSSEPVSGMAELNSEQKKFVSWLREDHGNKLITDAQLDIGLYEVTGQGIEQLKGDTRSNAQRAHDAQWPPAAPEAYNFPAYDDPENITADQTAFDKTARNWLSAGLFPKEEGSFVAREVNRLAEQMDGWSDWDHDNFQKIQMNQLTCIWREDTAKNIAVAAEYVRDLDAKTGGQLIPFLNASGIGNSSGLVIQIYNQAQRMAARNNGSK